MLSSVRTAAATTLRSSSSTYSGGSLFARACRSAGTCLSGGPPTATSPAHCSYVSDSNNQIPIRVVSGVHVRVGQQQQRRSIMSAPRRPIGGGVSDLTSSLAAFGLSASPAAAASVPTWTTTTTAAAAQSRRTFASKRFHRKKIIKAAKGYRGQANRNFRAAIKRVERARQNAYRDRRLRRREFRKLWIQRLNAGVRQHGVRYSRFVNMLNTSEVRLDRKILSELAMHEPFSFKAVVDVVKSRSADPRQRSLSG